MKQKYILGIIAISVIAVLGVSLVAANGFGLGIGNKLGTLTDEQKEEAKTNMDAIRDAIKNNDFTAWQDAMNAHIDMMKAQITEENFNQLVANHNEMSQIKEQIKEARESGDTETLKQLQEQYGFGGKGMGNGMGQGMHKGMKGNGMQQGMGEGGFGGTCPYTETQTE